MRRGLWALKVVHRVREEGAVSKAILPIINRVLKPVWAVAKVLLTF